MHIITSVPARAPPGQWLRRPYGKDDIMCSLCVQYMKGAAGQWQLGVSLTKSTWTCSWEAQAEFVTWPNTAFSLAMMMSAIMATSQPPPKAYPFTAAMMGLRTAARPVQPSMKRLWYA